MKANDIHPTHHQAKPIPEALAQYGTFDMDDKLVKMWLASLGVQGYY